MARPKYRLALPSKPLCRQRSKRVGLGSGDRAVQRRGEVGVVDTSMVLRITPSGPRRVERPVKKPVAARPGRTAEVTRA